MVFMEANAMADNNPIRRYSDVDIRFLTLFCDEDDCENTILILEGEYATNPPTYKLTCPKCAKVFHSNAKPGIVYTQRK